MDKPSNGNHEISTFRDSPWNHSQRMPTFPGNSPKICKPQPLYPSMPSKPGYPVRPPPLAANPLKVTTSGSPQNQHVPMVTSLPATKMSAIPMRMPSTCTPQPYPQQHQQLPRIMPVPPTVTRMMVPRHVPYPPNTGRHLPTGISYIPQYIITPKYPSGKKLFRCPQCRYVTDRKNNLKRHIGTMHQDCGKILECCDIIFPSKASLRDHVVLFHRSGYKCRYCARNFCRKALLKRHLVVHNGQKDFVCTICDYGTNDRLEMDEHKKMHHLKIRFDDHQRPSSAMVNVCSVGQMGLQAMYWNLLGLDINGESWMKSYSAYQGVPARGHVTMFPDRLKATHCKSDNANNTDEKEHVGNPSMQTNPVEVGGTKYGPSTHGTVANTSRDKSDETVTGKNRICTFPYKCSACGHTFLQQRDFIDHTDTCRKPIPEPKRPLKFFQDHSLPNFDHLEVQVPADDPECLDTLGMIRNLEQQNNDEDIDFDEDEDEEDDDDDDDIEEALDLSISGEREKEEFTDRLMYNTLRD